MAQFTQGPSSIPWADDTIESRPIVDLQDEETAFADFTNYLFSRYVTNKSSVTKATMGFEASDGSHREVVVDFSAAGTYESDVDASHTCGPVHMIDVEEELLGCVDDRISKLEDRFEGGDTALDELPSPDIKGVGAPRKKTRSRRRREAALLRDLMKKADGMSNPSITVCPLQLTNPNVRVDEVVPSNDSRLLSTYNSKMVKYIADRLKVGGAITSSKGFSRPIEEIVETAQFTQHNRERLSKRMLNYCVERIVSFDDDRELMAALDISKKIFKKMISVTGVGSKLMDPRLYTRTEMRERCNQGNASEYKIFHGVKKRLDPEMLALGEKMFSRICSGVKAKRSGKVVSLADVTSEPLCVAFGKTEVVGATHDQDGSVVAKDCRAIFPTSPVTYYKLAYLFYDLSKSQMDKFPCYGPGFAAGRSNDLKVCSMLKRVLASPNSVETRHGSAGRQIQIINRDIKHWDANLREASIDVVGRLLYSCVDKGHLDEEGVAIGDMIFEAAMDEVLVKLVEHPSGYLTWVAGTLPSGVFVTSSFNSNANILFCIASFVHQLMFSKSSPSSAALEILDNEEWIEKTANTFLLSLVCNGDNQIGTDEVYQDNGIWYDINEDAKFWAKLGMRMKMDETGVTTNISEAEFSSRKWVLFNSELYPTRPLDGLIRKLQARPFKDALEAKLFVRAMMIDYLGIDPLIFNALKEIDEDIIVDPKALQRSQSKAGDSFKDYIRSSFGVDHLSEQELERLSAIMCSQRVSRAALCTLMLPRSDLKGADMDEVNKGFLLGETAVGTRESLKVLERNETRGVLSLAQVGESEWVKIIASTRQASLYRSMSELDPNIKPK